MTAASVRPQASEQNRFAMAVAVSLAVHVLVLATVPGMRRASLQPLPEPLHVTLMRPVIEAARKVIEPPAPELPPLVVPEPRRAAPALAKRRSEPPAAPAAPAAPPVSAEPAPVLSAPPEAASPHAPFAVPAPPAPASTAPVQSAPAQPVQPEPAAESLVASYGNALLEAVQARRRYPRIAQIRGWQGTVATEIRFLPGGRLGEVSVVSSSGHAVLDEQALDMIRDAPLPPLPRSLRQREFVLRLPVEFRLRP